MFFAAAPLTGNPLAVAQDADGLSDGQMRGIAGEFNQAETTFILQSKPADRKLRSFTASGAEVFGASHNALGAWLRLWEQGDLGPLDVPRTLTQEIGRDVLPIEIERVNGRVHGRMRQARLRLTRRSSEPMLIEPIDDCGFKGDAVVAEGMIRLDLDMHGL
jgi:PhzF family phenazine biosynthesis protein